MLDFTKSAKRSMNVILIDGQSLMLRMPTKRVFDALVGIRSRISTLQMDDMESINEVYELLAVIMSNNLTHTKITVDYLADIIDFEDISRLYTDYMQFVTGVASDPN